MNVLLLLCSWSVLPCTCACLTIAGTLARRAGRHRWLPTAGPSRTATAHAPPAHGQTSPRTRCGQSTAANTRSAGVCLSVTVSSPLCPPVCGAFAVGAGLDIGAFARSSDTSARARSDVDGWTYGFNFTTFASKDSWGCGAPSKTTVSRPLPFALSSWLRPPALFAHVSRAGILLDAPD